MGENRVSVLGAGNTGFSLAANLAHRGFDVLLWEHHDFASNLTPIQSELSIALEGVAAVGRIKISAVTTDAKDALAWSDLLICSVPSYAHEAFADLLAPYFTANHLLALLPGNLGTLAFGQRLPKDVLLVESDTAPYVCRKIGPDRAVIWGEVPHLGIGAFPANRTQEAIQRLGPLFPGLRGYDDALEAGLSALNPVVHPAGVLMNAGRVERSKGEFYFYEEGVTPSVVRAIEALDRERLAIGQAYGYSLTPVADAFHAAGFGPAGDLWATINGSRMLTALRAPGIVESRWITEDVPFGIATWASLAGRVGVVTPVMEAIVALASVALGIDFSRRARTADQLGIGGLDRSALTAALANGFRQ